ncbi:MAG: methionyl-tRNA formyltransferase [Pseudomonadales bacterium]
MSDAPLRLGFAGTPEFAATILKGLLDADLDIALVLTQPDRPTGRGRKLAASPVKMLAIASGIEVRDPPRLKGVSIEDAALDLLVVAAYGLILPAHILGAPRLGCLNVHASLLPRWRGAAPVERAIMAGDTETGVCLMRMDRGLDTGPVYVCEAVDIGDTETGSELEARLAILGARLLVATLPRIPRMTPALQPEQGITYAAKITPEDSMLDWQEGAAAIARRIRALTHRQPVTVHAAGNGDQGPPARVRLLGALAGQDTPPEAPPGTILAVGPAGLEVACPDGSVIVRELQLNRGKGRPMSPQAAANGYPDLIGPGLRLTARPDEMH